MPAILLGALLLSLCLGLPARACVNSYDRGPVRRAPPPPDVITQIRSHPEHDGLVQGPAPADPGPTSDFKTRSNYAAVLVHRGDSRTAVDILERIEAAHPGEYIVAANLGTAYELSGDLVQAHRWIGEGMKRNAASHEGTEWLHLKILEARQALAKDPTWLQSNTVLGLDFGADPEPHKPSSWPSGIRGAEEVIKALVYQLHERIAFVPAPDPLVGSLIADLANLLLLYRDAKDAAPVYELAMQYRPVALSLVETRLLNCREILVQRRDSMTPSPMALGGFAVLAFGVAGLLVWRSRRASY